MTQVSPLAQTPDLKRHESGFIEEPSLDCDLLSFVSEIEGRWVHVLLVNLLFQL